MKMLTFEQIAMVSAGDNPGMGPYVPPFTPEAVNKFMAASAVLTAGLGGIAGGGISVAMSKFFGGAVIGSLSGGAAGLSLHDMVLDIAHQYNLRNGYDAEGAHYIYTNGTSANVSLTSGESEVMAQDAVNYFAEQANATSDDSLENAESLFSSSLSQTGSAYSAQINAGWGPHLDGNSSAGFTFDGNASWEPSYWADWDIDQGGWQFVPYWSNSN